MASKYFAYRLKKYRSRLGYSQLGAARLLDVTPTQLMEWERGKRIPTAKYLAKLEVLYHRLFTDMYAELREQAIKEIEESKFKYGEFGTGQPP